MPHLVRANQKRNLEYYFYAVILALGCLFVMNIAFDTERNQTSSTSTINTKQEYTELQY